MAAERLDRIGEVKLGGSVAKVRLNPRRSELAAVLAERDEAVVVTWADGKAPEVTARLGSKEPLKKKAKPGDPRLFDLAYHPSGDRLAVCGAGRAVEIHATPGGALERTAGDALTDPQDEVARYLAGYARAGITPSPETVEAAQRALSEGRPATFTAVTFSRGGGALLAARLPDARSHVLDAATGALLGKTWGPEYQAAIVPHPGDRLVAHVEQSGAELNGTLRFGLLREDGYQAYGRVVELNAFAPRGGAWSPDGRLFACVGKEATLGLSVIELPSCRTLYDFADGAKGYGWPIAWLKLGSPFVDRVAWSPDSAWLLCPMRTGQLLEVEARTGKVRRAFDAHESPILSCDARGGLLVTAALDGTVRIFRLPYQESAPTADAGADVVAAFMREARPIDPSQPGVELQIVGEDAEPPLVTYRAPKGA